MLLHAAMNHADQQMNNFGQRQLCDRTNVPQVGHCGRSYMPDDARVNRSKDRSVVAAEIQAGRRSAGAGGAHAEPASSTYARVASEAEAVAKSTGSELFIALPAMRKDWEPGAWLAAVQRTSYQSPSNSLPETFGKAFRAIRPLVRHTHSLIHKSLIRSIPWSIGERCLGRKGCQQAACEHVRTCADPLGTDCNFKEQFKRFGGRLQACSGLALHCRAWVGVFAAACASCAADANTSNVEALLMLGAAWSALNGDDTAPNPFGLALQPIVSSFSRRMDAYMQREGPVLTQALASTVPPQANLRCPLHVSPAAAALAAQLEPLYPTGRNLFYAEGNNSLSYAPYRVLPSLPAFNRSGIARRILVDVGAGPFHTSPKHLLDTYAAIDFPFTDAFLMEQSTDTGTVPSSYAQRTKIRQIKKFVRVGTRDPETDVVAWLPTVATEADFVALKFDGMH